MAARKPKRKRYHVVEADNAKQINFQRMADSGFVLAGLASHKGKLVAVFHRAESAGDEAARVERKSVTQRSKGNGK